MRKNSTLSNKCRIIFGSRTFWVETVRDPTERGRMTEAICREENA
jgi:head-tail adaptor